MNKLGIRNQLTSLLNRNDITDSIADTFIDQSMARIQRTLRIPPMEKFITYTTSEESPATLVLPNDFLELKHLYIDTSVYSGTLAYKSLDAFLREPEYGTIPKVYTRIQGALKVKPEPASGTEIYMVYYGEIPDLVEDTDESFLSAVAPDLLVYGALSFAADYYLDDRKEAFEQVYQRAYDELVQQTMDLEMSQQQLAIGSSYANAEY